MADVKVNYDMVECDRIGVETDEQTVSVYMKI